MFFQQGEIFWQLDKAFVGELMEGTERITCQTGDVLFEKGSPADYFYVLEKGRVKISIEEAGKVVHSVSHAGEAFGWSSLAGRDTYSASAICSEPTQLMRLSNTHVEKVCNRHPAHGMSFYKRLADILGGRLINSYKMLIVASRTDKSDTSGTGQLFETLETA
jgi:CRP-like cAMP-binding protein